MTPNPLVRSTTLASLVALLVAAPFAAANAQVTGVIYGHPLRRDEPKPPQIPTTPPIVIYPGYYPNYYRPYQMDQRSGVNVNVSNTTIVNNYITGYSAPSHSARYDRHAPVGGFYPVPYWQPEARLAAEQAAQTMPTDSADVKSIDAIIAALYDVISGPAGQARNWDRFRSLFAPGARLIPTGGRAGEAATARVLTPDEYAANAGPGLERNGFFEREIGRTMEQFGRIAHVFSAYDSKRTRLDPQPFARGINSIQLLNDGRRWWIVTVYWDSERPDNPIPAKYLGARGGGGQ